ncbi:hypothetical protein [Glycomyces sp. NPDC048151]|uniref:hypothetical protein n=1 Tax=Glycomyces sp. NPDC048151 TaxID=3364002 RepID=UPI00370FCF86
MNRSADPVLPRMPGSAILAVVFLGLQALLGLGIGVASASLGSLGLTVLVFAAGVLNAVLAVGVAMRKNWARMTGMVLCGVAIGFTVIGMFVAAAEGVPAGNPAGLGIAILLWFFLAHKNSRAWCNDLGREAAVLGPRGGADEPFTYRDRVELVEDFAKAGLRAGAVGTVVDLPAAPGTVVVEFDDHPDREPVQVTLHIDEIRPAIAAG